MPEFDFHVRAYSVETCRERFDGLGGAPTALTVQTRSDSAFWFAAIYGNYGNEEQGRAGRAFFRHPLGPFKRVLGAPAPHGRDPGPCPFDRTCRSPG
jgi:hypothetical protein